MFRQQAHDGERGDALAAAGFADQAEGGAVGYAEIDAVDRVRGAAVIAVEDDPQVPDFKQRSIRHGSLAIAASMPASIIAAIGDPGRIRSARQIFSEMHPALATDRFQAFQFSERIAVIVDAQVEIGPFFLAVNQKGGRLPAALVAARGLARAHRRDQASRERQAWFAR